MKKITILFITMLAFCLQSNAQFTFPTDAGPYTVVGLVPTTVNYNDAGNSAGVPSGTYGLFTVTVDWTEGAGGPWSSEADLTVTTANDVVVVNPPTAGGANTGAATTLTFSGVLPNGYDPDVDGSLDLTFNQSFAPSESNWANITITLEAPPEVPANDLCENAQALSCQETLSAQTVGSVDGEIWYSFTGTVVDDEVTVSLCGSDYDTIVTVFDACGGIQVAANDDSCGLQSELTFTSDGATTYLISVSGFNGATGNAEVSLACASTTPPANDECVDAIALDCTNNSDSGNTSLSTDTIVWYSFSGTVVGDDVTVSLCGSGFDTILEIYDACEGTIITANDDSCGLQSELTFTSDGVSTYLIAVTGFNGATGAYDINVSCFSASIPDNNDCASAEAIGCNDTVTGSTGAASDSDANGNPDVWYSYTGTVVGDNVTASLCGSGFDTIITVFDACGGTEVTANDDSCGLQSEVSWLSDGVTTYFIRVEGFNGASGAYELSFLCDSETPPANDDCADAEAIACGDSVIGSTANASDSEGTASPDVFYSLSGTVLDEEVTVSLCGSSFDTIVTVFDACGGNIVASNDDSCGLQSELTFTSDGVTTYIIRVEGFGTNSGDYALAVTCVPPPACTQAVVDSSTIVDSCNPDGTGTFTIDHVFSVAGDAGTVLDDGITTYAVIVGTVTTGPYNSGDSVTIELTGTDAACDFTVGTFEFTCPPPAPGNDEISGAINLPVGDTACETLVSGTNIGATDSIENVNEASCSSSDPAGDVWFQVTVPSTGELTIEISASATAPVITDTVMIVYSGTSGALVEIECDDDDGAGLLSLVALTGLTPGDVLLVRVWEWQNNFAGNFDICAFSPSTLGVEDNTFDGFNYFPNPVKDVLTLESPMTIDSIEILNVLGQRIMTIESQNTTQNIDMSNVQSGAYFVKVSIGNQTKTIRILKN